MKYHLAEPNGTDAPPSSSPRSSRLAFSAVLRSVYYILSSAKSGGGEGRTKRNRKINGKRRNAHLPLNELQSRVHVLFCLVLILLHENGPNKLEYSVVRREGRKFLDTPTSPFTPPLHDEPTVIILEDDDIKNAMR